LLPYLAEQASVTLFSAAPEAVDDELKEQFDVQPLTEYATRRWQYDMALYQIGNSSHHEAIYPFLLRYPGIVVLHDYVLHHFIRHRTVANDNYAGYVRELSYALGQAGSRLAWDIYYGRQPCPLFEEPLNQRVLDHNLGLIVHSQYARERVKSVRPFLPVTVIAALMKGQTGASRRSQLGLAADTVIFASLGQVTGSKKIDVALRCFAELTRQLPNSHYLIVGEAHPDVDLAGLINHFGLAGRVKCTGFVAAANEFADWIHTADIVLNLRYPTAGETSAACLQAMAAGRPVILFDHGWYSELPDSICCKVAPMNEAAVLAAMQRLATDPERRRQMGAAALAHLQTEHAPRAVATAYIAFIRERLATLWQRLSP
jgi:glycosyltransferase involved in cell wall biosynthesis